jgi:hypothetical protein
LYKIEFQKRGQPHAHILIFLKDRNILHDPYVIDKFINAEIPDKEADPLGYCNTPTTTTIGWEALPRYKTIIKQRQ